ncbi:hypothetical protein ZWY2020_011481 [Hordeum vulgare]|nr:hypothetical protein ZWY2020_011481 [Hordeum vulgare]
MVDAESQRQRRFCPCCSGVRQREPAIHENEGDHTSIQCPASQPGQASSSSSPFPPPSIQPSRYPAPPPAVPGHRGRQLAGIAVVVEVEEADAEVASVEEAVASVARSTKRKRPTDSNNYQHGIPLSFNLADLDSDPSTRKQIEDYVTPETRDEMRRAYLSKSVGHLYGHDFPRTRFGKDLRRSSFACLDEPSRSSTSTSPCSLCNYILKVSFGYWNYGIIFWHK